MIRVIAMYYHMFSLLVNLCHFVLSFLRLDILYFLAHVLQLQNLVLVNLNIGTDDHFPASMLTGALWAVSFNRCSK